MQAKGPAWRGLSSFCDRVRSPGLYGRSGIGSSCIRSAAALAVNVATTLPDGSNVVMLATVSYDCPSCASSIVRLI